MTSESHDPARRSIRFELAVLPVKVSELCLAVNERHPLHTDRATAIAEGFSDVLAPATFTVLQGWQVKTEDLQTLGPPVDYGRALHAMQAFRYRRPLVAGERLAAQVYLSREIAKAGRHGPLRFVTYTTRFLDGDGSALAEADYTVVELAYRPDVTAELVKAGRLPGSLSGFAAVVYDPMTRTDIARYAGASGDFQRLHVDESFAQANGEPSVFAPGMLTAGRLNSALSGWFDPRLLRSLELRLVTRVWPGDRLHCLVNDVSEDRSTGAGQVRATAYREDPSVPAVEPAVVAVASYERGAVGRGR
jgi:peroxisomal enoyl-CoA hydratase 2